MSPLHNPASPPSGSVTRNGGIPSGHARSAWTRPPIWTSGSFCGNEKPFHTPQFSGLPDGTLLLAVVYDGGGGPYFLCRSKDRGRTWERTSRCEPVGFKSKCGFFHGEAWFWLAIQEPVALLAADIVAERLGAPDGAGVSDDYPAQWLLPRRIGQSNKREDRGEP